LALGLVFSFPSGLSAYEFFTLGAALDFPTGPGLPQLDRAAQNLLRNAVASVLNAAHPDVDYPMTVGQVQSAVNTALASGVAAMEALEDDLDELNNLGCPLPLEE